MTAADGVGSERRAWYISDAALERLLLALQLVECLVLTATDSPNPISLVLEKRIRLFVNLGVDLLFRSPAGECRRLRMHLNDDVSHIHYEGCTVYHFLCQSWQLFVPFGAVRSSSDELVAEEIPRWNSYSPNTAGER